MQSSGIREGRAMGPHGVASLLLMKGTPLSLKAGGVQERTHIVPVPEDAYALLQSSKVVLLQLLSLRKESVHWFSG